MDENAESISFEFEEREKPPEEDMIVEGKRKEYDEDSEEEEREEEESGGDAEGKAGERPSYAKKGPSITGTFAMIGLNLLYGRVKAPVLDEAERKEINRSGVALDEKYKIRERFGEELDFGGSVMATLFAKNRWEAVMAARRKTGSGTDREQEERQSTESAGVSDTQLKWEGERPPKGTQ